MTKKKPSPGLTMQQRVEKLERRCRLLSLLSVLLGVSMIALCIRYNQIVYCNTLITENMEFLAQRLSEAEAFIRTMVQFLGGVTADL